MYCYVLLLLTATALLSPIAIVAGSSSHPITTLINAKYKRSNQLQVEIIEYLAEEQPNWYWDYLEDLNANVATLAGGTEQSQYEKCLELSKKYLGAQQLNLLKLSLSLGSLTPLIEANQQIANEVKQNCGKAFVQFGEKVVCTVKDAEKYLNALSDDDTDDVESYSFDHIYPGSENFSRTAVLYGVVGTAEFKDLHEILKEAAIDKQLKYMTRHYVYGNYVGKKVRLSGYGVELHLKSTEYKSQDDSPRSDDDVKSMEDDSLEAEVSGFDFNVLKSRYAHLSHSLDRLRSSLLENHDEIEPLKAWEFQELGLQAAQRVAAIQGEEALQILQFTAQNFPTQAKSLLPVVVSDDFKVEMKHNIALLGRTLNLQPPDAALFVNGLFYDADTLDMPSLMETLRSESRVLEGLHKIGLQGQTVNPLLALELSTSSKDFAIDIRDSSILWINDLENDSQYKRWPSSLMDLLRPTFPGMMRNIRKNLYNLVLVVDPIKPTARDIIKLAESFVVHLAPLRLGLVFDTRPVLHSKDQSVVKDYRAINCAFNYVHQKSNLPQALSFMTDIFAAVDKKTDITYADVQKQMKKYASKLSDDLIDDILGEDSDFDYGRQLSEEFIERIGLKELPVALLNGVPLQQSTLTGEEFEETVLTEIMQQTPTIQKAVYKGDLADSDVIVDYLMNQPHVMIRLNQRILSNEEPTYLDVSGQPHNDIEDVNGLAGLSNSDLTATLMANLKYFGGRQTYETFLKNKLHFTTIWVVGDLMQTSTKELFKSALNYMKSTNGVRISFIPNVENSVGNDLNALVWSSLNSLAGDEALEKTLKLLKLDNIHESDIGDVVKGFLPATRKHLKLLRVYCQRVLKLGKSASAIIVNGKVLGPLRTDETFTVDDFNLLEKFNSHQYSDKIRKALKEAFKGEEEVTLTSDILMQLITLLVPRQQSKSRFQIPTELLEHHTVVNLPAKSERQPYFNIAAVLDPSSKGAQKLAPILILLRSVINCNLKLILCAIDKHSDMPVKNFYRFVIEPEIQFTADGKQGAGPIARFTGLPANTLLTQNLNVPENWLVEVVRSVYDLDNIKLVDINGPVHSEYDLEFLLLEGHCFDTTSGAPPRGLQITLGTKSQPILVDTIVMANLGYFQLKANPGAWVLKLRHGKSSDIYDITTAEGANTIHSADGTKVIISSLKSHVLKLRVTKKPGMAGADLLSDDKDSQTGIWDSITSSFGGGGAAEGDDETINIFSVASGHLYERLLRIMMLSLLKHTKTPVKFWFLKNYLSPQFTDFLPHMAKEYNFQYELVQYKWPRWLHQQTEKQRTIWGYKILFLDVLFPLDVKKIIFVDADQIIRADMQELNNFDLGGAPYAYTPFCESRKEMEGFRFWKQGYWRNHLQGRRYHISALYVVDLKRFRRVAAGDRLRGQYQALSQDPNSLSNLDQDLPNNMIHQVALKSLPQDWLWCETWCSSETLKTAKTIDLCNNPLTKEAKLTAAKRIVPEWETYDLEVKALMAKVEEELEHEHNRHSEDKKGEPHTEL